MNGYLDTNSDAYRLAYWAAQERADKATGRGIPCGNGYISKGETCRVGKGGVRSPGKRRRISQGAKIAPGAAIAAGSLAAGAVAARQMMKKKSQPEPDIEPTPEKKGPNRKSIGAAAVGAAGLLGAGVAMSGKKKGKGSNPALAPARVNPSLPPSSGGSAALPSSTSSSRALPSSSMQAYSPPKQMRRRRNNRDSIQEAWERYGSVRYRSDSDFDQDEYDAFVNGYISETQRLVGEAYLDNLLDERGDSCDDHEDDWYEEDSSEFFRADSMPFHLFN